MSQSLLAAYPASDMNAPKPIVGNQVHVKPSLLKALCTARTTSLDPTCTNWTNISSINSTITPPTIPLSPIVTVAAPNIIGSCDNLKLDLTSSTGGLGRQWSTVAFTVQVGGRLNLIYEGLRVYCDRLVVSWFMWSAALDSSALLLPYSITSLA